MREDNPALVQGLPMATWRRLTSDDEWKDEERVEEITSSGTAVYVHRLDGARERWSRRDFASASAAAAHVARRTKQLVADGWDEDDPFEAPLPVIDAPPPRGTRRDEARARLVAGLPRFAAAWRKMGYDPEIGFEEECRRVPGRRLAPSDLADDCLGLAEEVFQTTFSRVTRTWDAEHGEATRIPRRLLADFYRSPARVLCVARARMAGTGDCDDDDTPGLEDEIRAQLAGGSGTLGGTA